MSADKYEGKGGSYVVNEAGERVLVEAPSDRFVEPLAVELQKPGFIPSFVIDEEDETAHEEIP